MAVLSGTYVAILGWALVMGRLHEQVAQFSAWGPLIVLMTLVALAGAAYWIRRRG
jgi:hypothetical protein